MAKKLRQFDANYFDEGFFYAKPGSPPKGGTRGCVSSNDQEWVRLMVELFGGKGYRFFDVGGGLGWVVALFRQQDEMAVGVDISEYAIKHSTIPEFMSLGDVLALKTNDQYDIVLCNRVLCYLESPAQVRALENLKLIMRRHLVVAVCASDHISPINAERALKSRKRLWPKSQWLEWFEVAGLKVNQGLTRQIIGPRKNWDCVWVLEKEQ